MLLRQIIDFLVEIRDQFMDDFIFDEFFIFMVLGILNIVFSRLEVMLDIVDIFNLFKFYLDFKFENLKDQFFIGNDFDFLVK